ncbi:DUF2474 family protein [Acetobacter persici]|uniref:Oxidase n=1 Tax=Acetobacter persici TaxID=1076596 RepID=A0A6V8I9M8_9PROT|nr:DUF2474 family protein [Acetobacter persici]OUI92072.1 oxidase [Acetobacter persici]GFE92065.1 hypothetical protein DmAi_01240 [Acetobacter persici]
MQHTAERPLWLRLLWFVGLWAAGVVALGVVAGVLRLLIHP